MQENKSNQIKKPEPKTNKNLWLILGVVALLAVGAVVFLRGGGTTVDNEQETQETEKEATTEQSQEVMLSEQNDSSQSGTALLEAMGDDTTRVTVNAPGPLAGPQPAHIHSGTCEDLGGVVYPLENVVEGYSQTVVMAPLQDLQSGTFAINLHQSPQQAQIYTACGNI